MDKETKRLLTGKRTKYAIIDEDGKVLAKGFNNVDCANDFRKYIRLNRYDKLEVVEEDNGELIKIKKKKKK